MQRECKIAMKSEEFVRRGLPQVKGSCSSEMFRRRQELSSETFRRRQGAVPRCESPLEGLRDVREDVKES
ncbi:UNVERIFIED_CONTAM: hypothetical protein Sradi_5222500 [Sesamum radiatum]|uniref:Uncharacterized protein n=1 Tax=Sesamum radiatum TaxID=300843 RepID=A0AAW2LKE5_SESRA